MLALWITESNLTRYRPISLSLSRTHTHNTHITESHTSSTYYDFATVAGGTRATMRNSFVGERDWERLHL